LSKRRAIEFLLLLQTLRDTVAGRPRYGCAGLAAKIAGTRLHFAAARHDGRSRRSLVTDKFGMLNFV